MVDPRHLNTWPAMTCFSVYVVGLLVLEKWWYLEDVGMLDDRTWMTRPAVGHDLVHSLLRTGNCPREVPAQSGFSAASLQSVARSLLPHVLFF